MTVRSVALVLASLVAGCATTDLVALLAEVTPAERSSYGYTVEDPVRIGHAGFPESIGLAREFLSRLRKDGERLEVVSQSAVGTPPRFTDRYTVVTESSRDTLNLYVDVYRSAPLQVPEGLSYVSPAQL